MATELLPNLQPHFVLGLETALKDNIHFLSDDEIVYPVGSVVTVHNFSINKQKYIKLRDKGASLTHVAVSPDKKLIATVETTDQYPLVTLWCANTFRKKRLLQLPSDKDIIAKRYATVDFTCNSKNLICVTAEPDWMLYCFKCDKGRLESSTRANNTNGSGTVVQVACNPTDINQLVVIGDSVLRCLGCTDYTWRQFGYNKFDPIVYTSCCWLTQDRIIIGNNTGKILILETGELRAVFHANELTIINMKLREELEEPPEIVSIAKSSSIPSTVSEDDQNYEIRSFCNFANGFAFGYLNGKVHVFEKESPFKYRKRIVYQIPDKTIYRAYDTERKEIKTTVNCIRINNAQNCLIATCNETQIYSTSLNFDELSSGAFTSTSPEIVMQEYGHPLHLGPIGCMSVARWKPLCMTAGLTDRSVKIWNYDTGELEFVQNFEDDIYTVALHPSGLYCLIGFSDKLRLMTITMDDLNITKEFQVRSCTLSSFSNLGHLFAATNGNLIQIYSTVLLKMMYVLKGHNARVTSISWCLDDTLLASCGVDGAIYIWDVIKSSRAIEVIVKRTSFTSVALSGSGREMYAVGDDGHIRQLHDSEIYRNVVLIPGIASRLDAVLLSQLDTMLFVAGNQGSVFAVKLPLMEKADYLEFAMHKKAITAMCITFDDHFIITGAADGSLCFWKILNADELAVQPDREVVISNEILISRQILQDKMSKIDNLQMRMTEMETEHSYQMRQNDASYSVMMKDIHAKYCNAIDELKVRNDQMEGEHAQEISSINDEIMKIKKNHEIFVHDLEASYNEKLIVEYKKFMKYEEKMDQRLKEKDEEYVLLKKEKSVAEEFLNSKYNEMVLEKDQIIEELTTKISKLINEHESIKQQIEDDCDREIYEMKTVFEKEIKHERDLNVRLKGEAAVIQKQSLLVQKESDDYKHQVYILENEHMKLKDVINNLESDILNVKKEITERDSAIDDKEERIFQLKNKNQELEKFKFILDYKIKELQSLIEPKERIIHEQIVQLKEMVREMENLQKVVFHLHTQLAQTREKLVACGNEIQKEINKNIAMKKTLKAIRNDIHDASGLIQNVPMLLKAIKKMYSKYNADKDFEVSQAEDTEARNEFFRQREFLERTVATLQTQAAKNAHTLSFDKVRLINDNAALLAETNRLRQTLRNAKKQNEQSNAPGSKTTEKARRKTDLSMGIHEEIHKKYKGIIQDHEQTIKSLVDENKRITEEILAQTNKNTGAESD